MCLNIKESLNKSALSALLVKSGIIITAPGIVEAFAAR